MTPEIQGSLRSKKGLACKSKTKSLIPRHRSLVWGPITVALALDIWHHERNDKSSVSPQESMSEGSSRVHPALGSTCEHPTEL